MEDFSLKVSEHCLQQLIVLLVELTRANEHIVLKWDLGRLVVQLCGGDMSTGIGHLCNDVMQRTRTPFPIIAISNSM